jgi:hypothetical protein
MFSARCLSGRLRLSLVIVLCSWHLPAQEKLSFQPASWQWNANVTGTISQVSFSNWTAGGDDYSFLAGLKSSIDPEWSDSLWNFSGSWEGRFSVFGGRHLPPQKTEDRLELNLKFGREIWRSATLASSLYCVAFTDLQSQFLPDYDLIGDPGGGQYVSNFLAPGYVTDGFGLDYRSDSLGLSVVLTPISTKQTLIYDRGVDRTLYNMHPGQRVRSSPGAYARINFSKELLSRTTLTVKTILFADYSEKSTVDVSFFGEVDYQVLSFLKLYLSLQMLHDDDINVRLYEDLDGDGSSDDFAGVGRRLQLFGQFGIGIGIDF